MTTSHEIECTDCGGECHCAGEPVVAVRGTMTGEVNSKDTAAEHASYTSFVFTGTNDKPVQILGFDPLRKRAVIDTQGVDVYLGAQGQISNGSPSGFRLTQAMDALELRNQEALYCIAVQGGGGATVSVLNERYASPNERKYT